MKKGTMNGVMASGAPQPKKDRKISKRKAVNEDSAKSKKRKTSDEELRKRLADENGFVDSIVSLMYVPKHKTNEDNELAEGESNEEARRKLFGQTTRVQTVDELHERLRQKMTELRGNRQVVLLCIVQCNVFVSLGMKGETKVKVKAKLSKKERKQKAKEVKRLQKKNLIKQTKAVNGIHTAKPATTKKVYNNDGKVVFSKFDFTSEETSGAGPAEMKKNLDPKSALQKIKKHKEKVQSLEALGKRIHVKAFTPLGSPLTFSLSGKTERVQKLEEKAAWKTALDKAEGVKVKDDVGLLKKSIKKLEQKKKSSKKKWEDRKEQVENKKQARQQKRTDNIKTRKDNVKKTKLKKAAKKGRLVPGFR